MLIVGKEMPQIRCPGCGITINLENRKKIDFDLIIGSLKNGSKTFTQLLRATHLPRKTLSLRLKELVDSRIIAKDRDYRLTDSPAASEFQMRRSTKRVHNLKSKVVRLIKDNPDGNRDSLMIVSFFAFLVISSVLTNTLMVRAHRVHNLNTDYQIADGTFEVKIGIANAANLYAWQGKITYDPTILKVVNVASGDFLSSDAIVINATGQFYSTETSYSARSLLIFATDASSIEGTLLVGGSLVGETQGSYGAGTLATVTFSVINEMETTNVNLRGGIMLLNPDLSDAEGILKIEL